MALTIAALLIAGAVQVFARSQQAYRTSEQIARLQETARHALSVLELDIRMAGYWGSSNRVDRIVNFAAPAAALPQELAPAADGINACGPNWAIDLARHEAVQDNRYALDCAAYNRRPQPDSDVLIVRRASTPVSAAPTTSRLRLVANAASGRLVIAPCNDARDNACGQFPPIDISQGTHMHDLLAHAYYVSRDATGRDGMPALRRKRLVGNANGAMITDEEIAPGIENLQVQVGITRGRNIVFVDPAAVDFDTAAPTIVAVRLWLLVRAEETEVGFVDTDEREFPPGRQVSAPRDSLRRLLVSTTVHLRNTRT